MTYVSFPGLGIQPMEIQKIAFSIGPLQVYWYGLIITVGMILAVLYALWHAKLERVKSDDVIDLALFAIVFGVIGARLYYVFTKFDSFLVSDGTFFENLWGTLYEIVAIWEGGLAIYGGIIGGFLAAFVVAKVKKISFPVITDIAGPAVLVGQILGRFGNFMNVEAYGGVTTLPWRMCSPKIADEMYYKYQLIDADGYQQILDGTLGVHPTFLYESLWNLIGFILITALYKKKRFHGQMFSLYITWYGFGRILIEGLRTDSLYVGPFRISQLVGFVTCMGGAVLLILGAYFAKKNGHPAPFATDTFAKAASSEDILPDDAACDGEINDIKTENTNSEETDNGKTD